MGKNRFQLHPSKIVLLPAIWLVVANYLYIYFSSRLQLPKAVDVIVIVLLCGISAAAVIPVFAAFIEIRPEGFHCIYPIRHTVDLRWEDIKSARAFTKKSFVGTEAWLCISAEENPAAGSAWGKSDGKTIYAIDRPELRKALAEHGITLR